MRFGNALSLECVWGFFPCYWEFGCDNHLINYCCKKVRYFIVKSVSALQKSMLKSNQKQSILKKMQVAKIKFFFFFDKFDDINCPFNLPETQKHPN